MMMTAIKFERTTVGRHADVILTAGMSGANGQIFGLFDSAEDVMADNADELAIGTVGPESLTVEQIALAERNSDRLCGIDPEHAVIAEAVDAADVCASEQVAAMCRLAHAEGRDWREVLDECKANDASERKTMGIE